MPAFTDSAGPKRHHIVIVGGGAGGLELATWLGKARAAFGWKVTLVDTNLSHLWKPRLHEVAVGLMGSSDDELNYSAQGGHYGFTFEWGALEHLDPTLKTIVVGPVRSRLSEAEILEPRQISYDTLVLAIGSRVNDFGLPGVAEHCHMLDKPADAHRLHRALVEAGFRASGAGGYEVRVGIVGAGATGVELAAELHHAMQAVERYGGVGVSGPLRVTLIDNASRVLAATDEATSAFAQSTLEQLGVVVRLNAKVTAVSAEAIHLDDGGTVVCDVKVWASGIVGHDVVEQLPLMLVRGKRIAVDAYLACVGANDIFALGDCSAALAADGSSSLPQTAQVAHQQSLYLFDQLKRRAHHKQLKPFVFKQRGTLISLGAQQATGDLPRPAGGGSSLHVHGALSKLVYTALYFMHRVALHGWFRASAMVVADWIRGITGPPVKLH